MEGESMIIFVIDGARSKLRDRSTRFYNVSRCLSTVEKQRTNTKYPRTVNATKNEVRCVRSKVDAGDLERHTRRGREKEREHVRLAPPWQCH